MDLLNRQDRINSILALLVFLMLFPGFYFYHSFVVILSIPPVFGGYFTFMTILMTVVICTWMWVSSIEPRISYLDIMLIFFLLYSGVIIFCYYVIYSKDISGPNRSLYGLSLIFHWPILYWSGKKILGLPNRGTIYVSLSYILMLLLAIIFSVDGRFYLQAVANDGISDTIATYQGFARSLVVVSIFIHYSICKPLIRFVVVFASLFALVLNAARSEVALFVIFVFVFEWCNIIKNGNVVGKAFKTIALSTLIVLLFCVLYWVMGQSRVFEFYNNGYSTSLDARILYHNNALSLLHNNFLFGAYQKYNLGEFSHDLLTVWVDFGLIGLILFLSVVICSIIVVFSDIKRNGLIRENIFVLSFLVAVVIVDFATKTYSYALLPFAFGLAAFLRSDMHVKRVKHCSLQT